MCRTKDIYKIDDQIGKNLYLGFVNTNTPKANKWTINMEINKTKMDLKIDSGRGINVLSKKKYYYKIKPLPKVNKTTKLTAYNTHIPVLGKCTANITFKNSNIIVSFIVAKTNSTPVLDVDTTEKLNIIKRISNIETDLTIHTSHHDRQKYITNNTPTKKSSYFNKK